LPSYEDMKNKVAAKNTTTWRPNIILLLVNH